MNVQEILNFVLLLSLFAGISFATTNNYMSDTPTLESGFGFDSSQSVSGTGITSTHSSINVNPEILQTHSFGSGYYSYDSTIRLLNFTAKDPANGFISIGRSIELQENTSFTYSPSLLSYRGTLRLGPIKSLWDDSIITGNGGGVSMKVEFGGTRALSKDVHTKVSGFENLEDILRLSGLFDAGIKFDAAFTGNEKLGMSLKGTNDKTPTRLVDEYYSGTYKMTKNLGIEVKKLIWDYRETSRYVDWLPCCSGGYLDMDLTDQRLLTTKDLFNCTTC